MSLCKAIEDGEHPVKGYNDMVSRLKQQSFHHLFSLVVEKKTDAETKRQTTINIDEDVLISEL